ncbi:MAG: ABC transporter permease [Bdellovibrionia bacterium]
MFEDALTGTIRLAIPLLFAAYGGMLSERSGIANIGLEATLLFSAFAAASATHVTGNIPLGILAGLAGGAFTGLCFGSVCIWGRADQIVAGTAFNFLAAGLIPVLCRAFFNVTGSTPALAFDLRLTDPMTFGYFGLGLLVFYVFFFKKTRHGLRIIAAGDNPMALASQGVSYKAVRLRAVIEGSVICSIGGVYMSLCQGSGYIRNMSAGRGFIALAALIFGGWRPVPTALACLFFGFTDFLQMHLQGNRFGIPNQFVQITPYVMTLLTLAVLSGRMKAPRAINQD